MCTSVLWASNPLLFMSGKTTPQGPAHHIWVLKTSVTTPMDIRRLRPLLDALIMCDGRWNFDLEDCDHILRVETCSVLVEDIVHVLETCGYYCAELEDIYAPASLTVSMQ